MKGKQEFANESRRFFFWKSDMEVLEVSWETIE